MIHEFKSLGVALVVVFATSAMVAAAAQATPGTLTTAGGINVKVTGEQIGEHVFTLTDHPMGGGTFATTKCKKAHFDGVGTVGPGATTVAIIPTYSECTAFGLAMTINITNCSYLSHAGTKTPAGTGWHVNTTLICPNAGEEIHVTTATCELTIPPQELNNTTEVTNSGGSPTDLLLHTNFKGITYTVTKDNIGCPLTPTLPLPKTYHQADYVGTTTIKGLNEAGVAVNISLH